MFYICRRFSLLVITLLTLLTSCGKARFEISLSLPKDTNTSYQLLHYASNSREGFWLDETIVVNNGEGQLIAPTARPTIVYLFVGSDTPALCFYARRGDKISISGESTNPLEWTVSGNDVNKKWTAWRLENKAALQSSNVEKINEAVAAYVNENKSQLLSALLLATTYNRNFNDAEFRKLWMSLDSDLRDDNKNLELLARADFSENIETPQLTDVVVRSYENGCDTLRFDKAKATIIFFWDNTDFKRNIGIDTLRNLARQYTDSARRNIVDIAMKPDSISWVSPLAADSLKHTLRVWMPLTYADKWIIKASPLATPSFIVADSKRKQLYRGTDAAKAADVFRKAMK